MNLDEVIKTRCSVRSYKIDPIPESLLREIFELARLAPSAQNCQPWRFLLIQSRDWLDKLHSAYPREWFMDAPAALIVSGSRDFAWTRRFDGYNSLETDLAIVMDHIVLLAWSRGLGTCWIANFEPEVLHRNLGLGSEECIFAMTPLGYPDESFMARSQNKERKSLKDLLVFL